MTLLEKAKSKYSRLSNDEILYNGKSFKDFLLECYLEYNPASYGKYIQKKLELELRENYLYLIRNEEKENCGDLRMEYPELSISSFNYKHPNGLYYELDTPDDTKPFVRNWEFKVSFLNKNSHYAIRNLRPYQKLNGGYLLCFVDCENDFKEEFYLVDFIIFERFFTLTHMNGTKDQHVSDGFQNYGLTCKKNSFQHNVLKKYSKIDGTKLSDLISYFKSTEAELQEQFWNTENCKKYVGELMEGSAEVYVRFKYEFEQKEDFEQSLGLLIEQLISEYDRILDIKITGYSFNRTQLIFYVKDKISGWDYVDSITEKYDKYFCRIF